MSYSQRGEDLYLARCFPDCTNGFYIDVGNGHPVYDNVSFMFYLRGWNGITVEPNPALAALSRAVRPRDHCHEALVGAAPGEGTFYRVEDFHGFSTAVADHANAALTQFGKGSDALCVPVTTLARLCEEHLPDIIDFLKIDVEGFEHQVILGGDWKRFRPKIVLIEALAPFTMAPAWAEWEPLLTENGYRYVFFDSLNRYYLADEAGDLARHFETAPEAFTDATLFRDSKPALECAGHPDHHLANLLGRGAMTRLPLLDRELLLDLATFALPRDELARPAADNDVEACWRHLFGVAPTADDIAAVPVRRDMTLWDLYRHLVDTDRFRAACGRISASYAW